MNVPTTKYRMVFGTSIIAQLESYSAVGIVKIAEMMDNTNSRKTPNVASRLLRVRHPYNA